MRILAIDPGNIHSGYVIYDSDKRQVVSRDKLANANLRREINQTYKWADHLAIEMIASQGMAVGKSVFDTCVWIGRFIECWEGSWTQVYRHQVKMHMCGHPRAKDANIRQALIDRFPATGGGKVPQIGTKLNPGPLYGMSGDMWAALAVAITYAETKDREGRW